MAARAMCALDSALSAEVRAYTATISAAAVLLAVAVAAAASLGSIWASSSAISSVWPSTSPVALPVTALPAASWDSDGRVSALT